MGLLDYGMSEWILWDSYGISLWFLCFPCYFYDLSMGFLLWDFLDISMIFLWDYYGMSIGSKLKSIEHKLKLNWNQLNISWNQLKVNWNQLKVNWNQLNINWNQLKSIENQVKVNWNQLKSIQHQLKSIEHQLKSIGPILLRMWYFKKQHFKESLRIVWGRPTLISIQHYMVFLRSFPILNSDKLA